MCSSLSISVVDNYGWCTCSVSSDLDLFFRRFVSSYGYISKLRVLREVKENNRVISRVYRIGDVTQRVSYDRVRADFLHYLEVIENAA